MFFPGATGAITAETFTKHDYHHNQKQPQTTKTIYLSRLSGAILFVSAGSLFQLIGYQMAIYMPFSPGSNLFESYYVYPLNYTIATCSIFTPTIINLLKNTTKKTIKNIHNFWTHTHNHK